MARLALRLSALLATTFTLTFPCAAHAEEGSEPAFDLVIVNGTIIDGTGSPGYRADIAIRGDRIAAISTDGNMPASGKDVLDATGLIVAPGFIDNHAHIATEIHEYPLAENFIRQGITSIIASLHSGPQPYPLKPYLDDLKVAPNVGFFAGHSFVRQKAMVMANRAPSSAELAEMREIVARSMQDGAIGLSTGLVYVPANYAKTDEVIALAKVAACYGGIYVSHMRDEGAGVLESVAEVIRIAREAAIPAQINHHKVMGAGQWGWSSRTLAMIDEARASGLDIKHDLYPYAASSTSSNVMFPGWALAGGAEAFRERIADPATRARIETEMMRILMVQRTGTDLQRIQFREVAALPDYRGKTLGDLAADRGLAGTPDDAIDLLIELQLAGGFSAIYHAMDEQDIVRIMQHPMAMFETDGDPVGLGIGFPHPRSYGSFPRVLARYVRDQGVLTLEEAIRRITSLAADQIGQSDRGRIREGAFADITVFDAQTVADRATYFDPHHYSVGIRHVVVNGIPVLRGSVLTGARPGTPLLGPAREPVSESCETPGAE